MDYNITPVIKNWCDTDMKVLKINYTWTVNKFSLRPEKTGEYLSSSTFSAGGDDNSQWHIRLHPKGDCEENKAYVSLYLALVASRREVRALTSFSLLNSKHKKIITANFKEAEKFIPGKSYGFRKFVDREVLKDLDLLSNDKLTIFCEVCLITESTIITSTTLPRNIPECRLSDDLEKSFENKLFSDVTLIAQGCQFQAHKAILAARSPVFAAMFTHNMKERKKNKVEIEDVDQDVLREMLRFIYTGKVDNPDQIMTEKLLNAADKYHLQRLKVMCENTLYNNLTVDNAVDVLMLSDLHTCKELKTSVFNFIRVHSKNVMKTEKWKSITQSHPDLTAECLRSIGIHVLQNNKRRKRN